MICIKQENDRLSFVDGETGHPVLWGGDLSISYTLKNDDITSGERPHECTPYESRTAKLTVTRQEEHGYLLESAELKAKLTVLQTEEGIRLELKSEHTQLSEFGLNLPFNFMGKLQGGGYQNQYLFSSPYRSWDNRYQYCYLKNINGNDILVLPLSPADGWKMDYSSYVGGHYFVNLKYLANFDRVYQTGSDRMALTLMLLPVKNMAEGIEKAAQLLQIPAVHYEKSYSLDGSGELTVVGDCDYVELDGKLLLPVDGKIRYTDVQGKTVFTPYKNGEKGMDCSVLAWSDIWQQYEKSNDVIARWAGLPNLGNACECQCWAGAMLKYMLRHGIVPEYDRKLQEFFRVFLTDQEEKAVARLTLFREAHGEFPAYSVFRSRRIQEHAFAVSMLLDAYQVYGEEIYLQYATGALDSLLDHYQQADGRLETSHSGKREDYSTVCCPMIPIVDMALFLQDREPVRAERYRCAAKQLAAHIFRRGFRFPTEGGDTPLAEEQMEDGSISCSALSLLYYCTHIERCEDYEELAKQLLDFHEHWVIETPDASMYRSSLRWWETRWEGDGDGPALCCGHAWTIWRSEADYWYYKLTGDRRYWEKALCGFTTNFAKFDSEGHGKSIYNADYITGGGFGGKDAVRWRIAPRLPEREDVKTARYAWMRAAETVLKEI